MAPDEERGRLPASPREGPYLAVATLFERVLIERDGVASGIRMVDNVNLQVPEMPPGPIPDNVTVHAAAFKAALMVCLKSGRASGRYELRVILHPPIGEPRPYPPHTMELSPEPHGGALAVFELTLLLDAPGLYSFELLLDGEFLTAVPLNVAIQQDERPT